jgi:putative ATPase
VWALARTPTEASALIEIAARLPAVERPIVLTGELDELTGLLAARGEADVRFDASVGRNALTRQADKAAALGQVAALLRLGGILSLAEAVPCRTQRLYRLAPLERLAPELAEQVRLAEEAIYADPGDPMVNWDAPDLEAALAAAGLAGVRVEVVEQASEVQVTPALLARWFEPAVTDRSSYGQRLAARLSEAQLSQVRDLFERALLGQAVTWASAVAYVTARK